MDFGLSVLDISPVSSGSNGARALRNTLELSRLADQLGYERYWLAEHHNLPSIAAARAAAQRDGSQPKRERYAHFAAPLGTSSSRHSRPHTTQRHSGASGQTYELRYITPRKWLEEGCMRRLRVLRCCNYGVRETGVQEA